METISISSDIKNIPIAINFVNLYLKKYNLDFAKKADVVLDEILSNISKYSYKNNYGIINIHCDYEEFSKTFILKFVDSGINFNPLDSSLIDTNVSIENRYPGGLGIFIVKCIMDEMDYNRHLNKNILTLKKFFK